MNMNLIVNIVNFCFKYYVYLVLNIIYYFKMYLYLSYLLDYIL